jgi:hypothetical protein
MPSAPPSAKVEYEQPRTSVSMPAKDLYHETVKMALIKEDWTITKESLTFMVGKRPAIIDLAAEKIIVAEKGLQKIAVEVKSFLGPSLMTDLEKALGQFVLYSDILAENDPDRILYLAIPQSTYEGFFAEEVGQMLSRRRPELKFIIFDPSKQEVTQWKPLP